MYHVHFILLLYIYFFHLFKRKKLALYSFDFFIKYSNKYRFVLEISLIKKKKKCFVFFKRSENNYYHPSRNRSIDQIILYLYEDFGKFIKSNNPKLDKNECLMCRHISYLTSYNSFQSQTRKN